MPIFSPHFVIAPDGARPYLRRWFMTPWSSDDHPLKSKRLPNIYLHQILRSDDDRALHDHPWDNVSIILWGGYIEHVFAYQPVEGRELPPVVQKRRRMFHIVRRRADMPHRLELYRRAGKDGKGSMTDILYGEDKPCWSLFITWRKRRPWGFWGTKEGVIGEYHTPVFDKEMPKGEVERRWLTLQHKGPVARWIHNAVFETVQKMKG